VSTCGRILDEHRHVYEAEGGVGEKILDENDPCIARKS
jgi:hypothetical protein